MAYYQNGPYYRPGSSQQQQQQAPPAGHYQPRRPSFESGDEAAFAATNGRGADQYGYGHLRSASSIDRRGSYAVRQHDELFMGDSTPPLDMPSTMGSDYASQYQSVSSPTYDPRQFPAPVQIPNPQAFGGMNRTQFDPAAPHQPYNPAAYTESNIGRSGTTASRQYEYSPPSGYSAAPNSAYPTSPHAQVQFPSPSISQQAQFSPSRTQSGYGQRPSVHSPVYHTSPSRSSAYSPPAAPPPLPVPPHSAGSPPADWQEQMARRPSMASIYNQWPSSSDAESRYNNPLPSPPVNQGTDGQEDRHSSPLYHSNPLPPTPGPRPPQHSPQRTNTSGRHPQARPLPGPPLEAAGDSEYFHRSNSNSSPYGGQLTTDDLYEEIENAVMNAGSSPRIEVDHHSPTNGQGQPPFYASLAPGGTNGHLSPNNRPPSAYSYSDESDAEAAAGLAALQMAEEEERRGSGGATLFSSYSTMQPPVSMAPPEPRHTSSAIADADLSSDNELAGIDIGAYEGNFAPTFHYGGNPTELASVGQTSLNRSESQSQTLSSSGSMRKSGETSDADAYDPIHPFPPFSSNARVDTFGTGGFAEPGAHRRRLSYDEGDESSLMLSETSTAVEPPDMFYHPGMSQSRPLPPPPAGETHFSQQQSPYGYQQHRGYPAAPEQMMITPGGSLVPRSTSLISHSSTPQTVPPIRSKTDAEERRLRNSQIRTSLYERDSSSDNLTPPTTSTITLDLPALPSGKRFNPAKLTPKDFARCIEPWALSSVVSWLRAMGEGETDLKEHLIFDGLVALFTHKVPTMNVADAEALSTQVVEEMYRVGTIEHVEEWLKFTPATPSGVMFQLTHAGCYAPKLHEYHTSGRCYSYHCQRTLKKIDLHAQPSVKRTEDWASFHKVKKEDIEGINKKEVERQNILHEIVQTEDNFMDNLNVLRLLYRDGLMNMQPPCIPPKKMKTFLRDVFGKVDAVKQANEEHLLPQMKYRQQEQGPWVIGFSDIFREWIRKARNAYIEYAAAFPYATFLVRQEAERNILFRSFLDQARANKLSNKLAWDNYLKSPITRLQHYGLLLGTVLKRSLIDNEEKKNLMTAIEEIKAVTLECDARVAEMSRKVDLTDLQSKLILRPGMQRVELNLNHLGRELIFKGDLQRMGGTKFTWLETHALLFDHYLVLAKTVHHRDVEGGAKQERYDVSRLPIPMDLLVLESTNDDPVVKSSVKGVATVTQAARPSDARLRAGSNASPAPGALSHVNTGSSMASTLTNNSSNKSMMVTSTVLDSPKDEKIMYPFRIKHLGKEIYTLFAPTAQNRQDWCDKILEAKTKHAAALFAQNAEPFRLRVMADSAFAHEGGSAGSQSITIKGTPLDRAIDEVEKLYSHTGRPIPICRARVNCATAFMQPYGKPMVAVGTDYGVYISDIENPRGWSRAITIPKVTQVAVLEEFSLMLLISDKSLIAYHLDMVCPAGGVTSGNSDSSRRAPQKLSGSRDVGFFASGKMKDRTLVFYKKREGLSSTFKVLEPVFQKSTEKKSRFLRTGRTEFFRDYDEFYIPTECYGLNLFHSSLAVSTSKGFEVLTLDKKQPWSVPDLKASHVATIASRLQGLDPLGMFRLSDQEFLLCYEECAVYVNKHGDVSRSVIMEFVGKARAAALYGPYVLLFDPDFVEVRNAQNGRLRQVIPGRDVKCLDDGLGLGGHWVQPIGTGFGSGQNGLGDGTYTGASVAGGVTGRTVKLAMQHPRHEKCQIVVELLLNEGQRD